MGRIGIIVFLLIFASWTQANPVKIPETSNKKCAATAFMDPILKNCNNPDLLCSAVFDIRAGICLQISKDSTFVIPENFENFHKELTNLKNSTDKKFVETLCDNKSSIFNASSPLGNWSKLSEALDNKVECYINCFTKKLGANDLCVTLLWAKQLFEKPVTKIITVATPPKLHTVSKTVKLGESNVSGKSPETPVYPPNENSSSEKTNFSQSESTAKKTQEKKEQGKIAAKSPDVEVSKKSETEEKEDEQSQMKSDNVQEIEDQKQSGDNKEINEVFEDKEKDQDNDESLDIQAGKPEFKFPGYPIESDVEDSHLLTYFSVFTLICIVFYIGLHNKQKILAIILEGRRGRRGRGSRRRPSTANYRKLDSNLEEAVTSQCSLNATQVIY